MKTKKLMWAYLLKHGTTAEFSFYGGGFDVYDTCQRDKDLKILREISRDGVDWKKTQEPRDGNEWAFTDTFHDSEMVATLEGTIVTNKGKKYDWATEWKNPRNVFHMFAELSELNFDADLKQRCIGKKED